MTRPQPLRLHLRERRQDGVKRRRQIDGDDGVPLCWRKRLDGLYMLDARIVDQHIDAAKQRTRVLDHAGYRPAWTYPR